jgi:hypothetical protein
MYRTFFIFSSDTHFLPQAEKAEIWNKRNHNQVQKMRKDNKHYGG